MPFELGMYYMHLHEKGKGKKMLILEGEKDKSDTTISDLSGIEIKCHYNDLEGIFKAVRPFFFQIHSEIRNYSANKMYDSYIMECLANIKTEIKKMDIPITQKWMRWNSRHMYRSILKELKELVDEDYDLFTESSR
jgi:hypothetical protein